MTDDIEIWYAALITRFCKEKWLSLDFQETIDTCKYRCTYSQ